MECKGKHQHGQLQFPFLRPLLFFDLVALLVNCHGVARREGAGSGRLHFGFGLDCSIACVVPVLRCTGTEVVLDGEVSFLFHRSVFLDLFSGLRATGFTTPALSLGAVRQSLALQAAWRYQTDVTGIRLTEYM